MSVTKGPSKFSVSTKYYPIVGATNTKTKTVSGLNLKLSDEGSGNTVEQAYSFFAAVNTSIVGGTMPTFSLSEENVLSSIEGGE